MNGISEISDATTSMISILSVMSSMITIMALVMGVFKLMHGDMSGGFLTCFIAITVFFAPTVMKSISDTGVELGNKTNAEFTEAWRKDFNKNNESTQGKAISPSVEKQVVQEAPKKPKPVIESKPVDYKPFLYILGGIIGSIISIVLIIFMVKQIVKFYKFRKAYKFVTRIAGLPNDFIALSSEIDQIDSFLARLNDMVKLYNGKKKQELLKLQVILEDKKYMFNGIINNIKASQPELNAVYQR